MRSTKTKVQSKHSSYEIDWGESETEHRITMGRRETTKTIKQIETNQGKPEAETKGWRMMNWQTKNVWNNPIKLSIEIFSCECKTLILVLTHLKTKKKVLCIFRRLFWCFFIFYKWNWEWKIWIEKMKLCSFPRLHVITRSLHQSWLYKWILFYLRD